MRTAAETYGDRLDLFTVTCPDGHVADTFILRHLDEDPAWLREFWRDAVAVRAVPRTDAPNRYRMSGETWQWEEVK